MKNQDLPYSVAIEINTNDPQQRQYLEIIEKAMSVDGEIDEENVLKEISHTPDAIKIKVSARQVKLLRSCVTGLLRHIRLSAETIKQLRNAI